MHMCDIDIDGRALVGGDIEVRDVIIEEQDIDDICKDMDDMPPIGPFIDDPP